jgi:hypothetical protein
MHSGAGERVRADGARVGSVRRLLSDEQETALASCERWHLERERVEALLSDSVKDAIALGVPLLTLSRRLGVSRHLVRRLGGVDPRSRQQP